MSTLAPSFLNLAASKDNHERLDQFEFRLDPIADYGVSCP